MPLPASVVNIRPAAPVFPAASGRSRHGPSVTIDVGSGSIAPRETYSVTSVRAVAYPRADLASRSVWPALSAERIEGAYAPESLPAPPGSLIDTWA